MPAESHATLGASSASRWINCPGSVSIIDSLPKSEKERTSLYADEGTAAHNLAEHCLTESVDPASLLGTTVRGKIQEWPVNDEMADAIHIYTDEIYRQVKRLGGYDCVTVFYIERHVKPLDDRDDLWGTADVILYAVTGEMVVIDFKYGRGVVVEVEWNDQAMFYGLGALREIGVEDVTEVTLIIVQPRAPHPKGPVRPWTFGVDVLVDFADDLRSAAAATENPEAPLKAGNHCRFCPAAALHCEEMRKLRRQVAVDDFSDLPAEIEEPAAHVRLPNPAVPEELAEAMKIVPLLDFWTKEVKDLLNRELQRGVTVPGFKLVRGRSNRAWKDKDDVERRLKQKQGIKSDRIYKKTLQTPAQIEKVVGKPWVARHAHKPEGALTVVPESDPREAVTPLLTDFADAPPLEDLE